ncbi:MAG TPA: penicillin acylase family protein [Pyrinomonadaceae bacterium]|jgi:penicillin amidase
MSHSRVQVCLFTLLCLLSAAHPVWRAHAQTNTSGTSERAAPVQLAGLRSVVNIRRDERGVPYLEAANEDDLYFAQGFITASDRLWQMDLLRRAARGELSEIFGSTTLEEDKRRRAFGFAAISESSVALLAPPLRRALEAYARGVNAYIATRDEKNLPTEFQILGYKPREWRPADSLVVGKNLAEALSTSWQKDLLRAALADIAPERRAELLAETSTLDVLVVGSDAPKRVSAAPPQPAPALAAQALAALSADLAARARTLARIGLDAEEGAASNNWVVSGAHSASGQPMLANDPHLSPAAPSIWHLVSLSAPGLHVAGVTLPGAPGVVIGHNERIAWGMTNLDPDVQDLYAEKFDPANPRRYQTPQGWRDADIRHEEIRVRKSPIDAQTEVVAYDVTVTRHGPVIFEQGGVRYALRWPALEAQAVEFAGLFHLNRAGDWQEFTNALSQYTGPTQNFVYADTKGHIGYYGAGRIPVRKSGDGSTPYDGATDAGEWTGYIPFNVLPHSYDPPGGIIVTANQRVIGRDYPYFLTHEWAQPYRARRILNLLQAKPKLTTDDFRAIQADVYSFGGATFARGVVEAMRGESAAAGDPLAEKWRADAAALAAWDGRMDVASHPAALVAQMRAAFRRRLLTAALGAERARSFNWSNFDVTLDRIITERPAAWLPKEFNTYAELLRVCYADARQALAQRLGADETKWTWGNWAQVRFPHPLAGIPLIGQKFAIKPFAQQGSGYAAGTGPTVNVGAGVSMRFVVDTSDWDKTLQGIAPGEAGDPDSPHWQDQVADWRDVQPRLFPFSKTAVNKAATATLVLSPQGK